RQWPRRVRRGPRQVHGEGDRPGTSPAGSRRVGAAQRVAASGQGLAEGRRRIRGHERRQAVMTMRRWAAVVSGLVVSVAAVGSAPADTAASAAKFQAAVAEWKSKIVPAAKKEGEVIWYSCAQATEAEGTIKVFN